MTLKIVKNLDDGLYFLNGKRETIPSDNKFSVFEPRTGEIIAECPIADKKIVESYVELANESQPKWGNLSPLERSKILIRAGNLVLEHLEEIAIWEVKTNGKPISEAREDIRSSADTLIFYGGILPAAIKGDYFDLPINGKEGTRFAYTRREPFGVVGCIGAWNYPFQTAVWKVAPALAAGNAVVYKPSPFAPASPVLLGEVLTAAGLPDGVYNVLQGEGETGQNLCLNELIYKVSFTGSVATGKKIQEACSKRSIKPATLELGGKSAFVIFEDADLDSAVSAAIIANFYNQGEVCTNATRVFVHEDIVENFTKKLLKELEKIRIGDPLKEDTNVGATINELQLKKVVGFVERAQQQGAKVLRGGKQVHPVGVENGFYFDPAVVTNVSDNFEIVQEEIFGAVLLILPFSSEDEVLKRVNNTTYGLASGLYTKCLARAHRVAAKIQAGTIFINTFNDTEVHIPFGGFKNSGHGRENCVEALHGYTQIKAVYVNIDQAKLGHHL